MTRKEIENLYGIATSTGRLIALGKFEGKMAYVPYFWDFYLNGFYDDDDGEWLTFEVTDDDRRQFPELGDAKTVRLRESDTGFIYSETE